MHDRDQRRRMQRRPGGGGGGGGGGVDDGAERVEGEVHQAVAQRPAGGAELVVRVAGVGLGAGHLAGLGRRRQQRRLLRHHRRRAPQRRRRGAGLPRLGGRPAGLAQLDHARRQLRRPLRRERRVGQRRRRRRLRRRDHRRAGHHGGVRLPRLEGRTRVGPGEPERDAGHLAWRARVTERRADTGIEP